MKNYPDYKRLDKIAIRNVNEKVDFHDICKTLLVRILRRKHKNKKQCYIYTEHDATAPNSDYPDIYMELKDEIIIWELQEDMNINWINQIKEKHEDKTLIIVPLQAVLKDWQKCNNFISDPIKSLSLTLETYAI